MRHDVTLPALRRGRRDLQPRLPGLADPLPARSRCRRPRPRVHGAINMLGLAKRVRAKIFQASTSEVYGDPDGPSADRELLGQRQSDRPALLLRRGQALRRDAVLRLPPPAQAAHQGGAHLQHLRPAHASERRPRGVELHRPGAEGRAHHDLRRRHADALLLLCRRSDRGLAAPDGHTPDDFTGPINLGNPVEIPVRELAEQVIELTGSASRRSCTPAAADRRSDAALPGHHPGAQGSWTGSRRSRSTKASARTIAYFDGLLKSNKEVSRVGR